MDTAYMLFGVLLFVAVVLALEGLYHLWAARHSAEAKRIAARLRFLDGESPAAPLSIDKQDPAQQQGWLHSSFLSQLTLLQQLHETVRTSGTGRKLHELLLASVTLGLVAAVALLARGLGAVAALTLAATAAALPWLWLAQRRAKHLKRLEQQLPLALDLMSRALRAGHTLPTAVKMVSEEMSNPMAAEFRQMFDETNFGMSQAESLIRLAQRVPLEDMRFFAVAVMIQREAGGNLTELLDNLASIVRARIKLLGQVRTLSAEGRLSAWVLGLMPFVVAALLHITSPEFIALLWTEPAGRRFVTGALVLMALGALWMRGITRIRV
jgi:tight adherence protein B